MKLNKIIVTSDLHFAEIINFFPDPCFAIDLEGKVIAWNQAMVELTGISSFDMLGKGEYEYAISLYGNRRPILIDLAITWNEDIAKTYKYVKKNDDTLISEVENVFIKQKLLYLWNTARKLYNINGDCIGAIEVIRDITEINKAKELSYRYDLLKKESRDIILFINIENGCILEANNAAVNAYGYNHNELLSMAIWDLRVTPGWNLVVDQMIEAKNKGIIFEAEHKRKDGSIFPVEVSSNGVTTGSGRILISIIRDISERKKVEQALKESEARFRTVVENSWDGIHQLDLHTGKYVFVSPSQERLTGFKIEELMLSMKDAAERVHPDDRASVKKYLKQIISGGRPEKPMEYRWRMKSGEYRWFSDSRKAVFDENGKAISLVGITRDITEIKQIQTELEKSKIELEKKVAERTRLAEARAKQLQTLAVELIEAEERERRRVAELLHDDLQQMLAAARMQLELACRRVPSESTLANVVQLLEESIEKSRRLSYELSPAMLQHSGLFAALQWLVRQQGEKFGLHVELESNGDQQLESTPLKVFLFRAVQELLFNIVKHAKVKSARVVLSVSDSCISISVSDKGRGFNPLNLDNHTLTEGLGLLSLRERTRYIGGTLVIESIPGKGSCFTLTVPFCITEDKKSQPLITSDNGQSLSPGDDLEFINPRDIRVLFVDDHQVMRQGLISLISGQPDIQVVGEAANGLEAIRMVRQLKPDVVLMDVSMPEMDGIEATRQIKADIPDVRVIGLSMFDDEQMASTMLEAGAESFVSKTASLAELLKAIYAVFRFTT
jgi:PAS domain S-box-containing protein